MAIPPPFAPVFPLNRRRTACLLAGFFLFGLAIAGSAVASRDSAAARISAHLTKKSFADSEAGSVKLIYRFSKPSKSFSYRLSFQNGANWQAVKAVKSKKKKGYFKGSRSITVEKLFAGKQVRAGAYRLELGADAAQVILHFRVTHVVASPVVELEISVLANGEIDPSADYTLTCPGGHGTLPAAAYACDQLSRLDVSVFAPVRSGTVCTANWEGPQIAQVTGRFHDDWIDASFDLHNGCEISRWHRLGFLFPLAAELEITVWPSGESGDAMIYELNCPDGDGTLPAPASACSQLSRLGPSALSSECEPLDPSSDDPQSALVEGSFAGRSIYNTFDRSNDCEIAHWDALAFLFPLETDDSS